MNLASLYSGGKDSAYSIFLARDGGHRIKCLLTAFPASEQSLLLHHPNIRWTRLQSESMRVPQVAVEAPSDGTQDELAALERALSRAKDEYDIRGLVHGGMQSEFQKASFEALCETCGLEPVAPLWGIDPYQYMQDLTRRGFRYVITSVSSGGLDGSWLGRNITADDVEQLARLSARHGFNMNFEGGEAETFVTDCPLFSGPIEITRGASHWDGYRGRFEIVDARLTSNA